MNKVRKKHLTFGLSLLRIGHENFELLNHDIVNSLMLEGETHQHLIFLSVLWIVSFSSHFIVSLAQDLIQIISR